MLENIVFNIEFFFRKFRKFEFNKHIQEKKLNTNLNKFKNKSHPNFLVFLYIFPN